MSAAYNIISRAQGVIVVVNYLRNVRAYLKTKVASLKPDDATLQPGLAIVQVISNEFWSNINLNFIDTIWSLNSFKAFWTMFKCFSVHCDGFKASVKGYLYAYCKIPINYNGVKERKKPLWIKISGELDFFIVGLNFEL